MTNGAVNGFGSSENGIGAMGLNASDENEFFGSQEPVSGGIIPGGANIPISRQAAAPTPPPSVPRIEPEKIKKWREEQRSRLEKKGA